MTTEPAELVLSASSLKSWLGCGYRYYLEHVYRLPAAPNMDMAIGSATHAGVEAAHNGAALPRAALAVAFAGEVIKMPGTTSGEAQAGSDSALAMYELYQAKIAPTFHPTIVERDFVVRLNGVLVSGRIDAADEHDVHDLKTTSALSKFRPEFHRLQMSLYAHGFAAITGRKPVRLLLDVVARNLRWKTVEIEPDDGELADVLALASRGIIAGEYEPTGVWSGACQRCPYALEVCEYARID